jgi:putative ABC transport system permease protein
MVKSVIPLALGDSYRGFRIVGTSHGYAELYSAALASGDWWSNDFDMTLGATAAEFLKLKPGDKFASAHGLTTDGHDHEKNQYVVKGIMVKTNTVLDNLMLTNIESVWKVHAEDDDILRQSVPANPSPIVPSIEKGDSVREITSLLVRYRNPLAAIQLPRFVNNNSSMQAASPAFETARLFSLLGIGVEVLRGFAYVLILISGLSIFIALYNSLRERQYDMAIMRSMGGSRMKLFMGMLMEGTVLTFLGSLGGLAIGHAVLWLFTVSVEESEKAGITAAVFYSEEGYILIGSVLLGTFCSFIPAIQAYRTDIHKVLAGN